MPSSIYKGPKGSWGGGSLEHSSPALFFCVPPSLSFLPFIVHTTLLSVCRSKIPSSICWGNSPAHEINGPHVAAQGPICKYCTHQGAGAKLPPPSHPIYSWPKGSNGDSLPHEHFFTLTCSGFPLSLLFGGVFSPTVYIAGNINAYGGRKISS